MSMMIAMPLLIVLSIWKENNAYSCASFSWFVAHHLSQLLIKTLRIQYDIHPNVDTKQQYAYGFLA